MATPNSASHGSHNVDTSPTFGLTDSHPTVSANAENTEAHADNSNTNSSTSPNGDQDGILCGDEDVRRTTHNQDVVHNRDDPEVANQIVFTGERAGTEEDCGVYGVSENTKERVFEQDHLRRNSNDTTNTPPASASKDRAFRHVRRNTPPASDIKDRAFRHVRRNTPPAGSVTAQTNSKEHTFRHVRRHQLLQARSVAETAGGASVGPG
jgi:hypothetical protein